MDQKKCTKCGEVKLLSDFNASKSSKDGKECTCSVCRAANKRRIRREKQEGAYKSSFDLGERTAHFLLEGATVHGGTFTYERVKYIDTTTPVEIFCKKHSGYFWQIPNSHLNGVGCKQCGISRRVEAVMKTQEEFLEECFEKRGTEYDYTLAVYSGYKKNITIGCNRCNTTFRQTPATHLRGSGCPTCSAGGYSRSLSGSLYVMSAGDVIKVGITNLDTSIRETYLTNAARKVCSDFPPFSRIYVNTWEDGNTAYDLETQLLVYLKGRYKGVDQKFNGSTECFLNVNVDKLISLLPTLHS